MSTLPPKADIRCSARHVRLVPQADIRTASFDQLSGNGEQLVRKSEAQRLSSREIDD
jgi:hypothetical protein